MAFEQDHPSTRVSNAFLMAYMPEAPATYVPVYLYGLMLSQAGTQEIDVAEALHMTETEVTEALLYWDRQGLIRLLPGDTPSVIYADTISGEAVRFDKQRDEMADLLGKVQSLLKGRVLGLSDTSKIYDWVKIFGLSEDAVVCLIQHYITTTGQKKFVSFDRLHKTARIWADNGVVSLSDAEAYIQQESKINKGLSDLLTCLGLKRQATNGETSTYNRWVSEGFSSEVIILACKELLNYRTPSFALINTTLETYKRNGMVDVNQVIEYQRKVEQAKAFHGTLLSRLGMKTNPTRDQVEVIAQWRTDWHMEDELIFFAADCSTTKAHKFKECQKLVQAWHEKGITKYSDAKADYEKNAVADVPHTKKSKAMDYLQRPATEAETPNVINFFDD